MRKPYRNLATIAIAILAAFAGAGIARFVIPERNVVDPSLLTVIRPRLDLTASQNALLETMQSVHDRKQRLLTVKIRAQNLQISKAIDEEHGPGPAVLKAIQETQVTINTLQREDIILLLEARSVLNDGQKSRFDALVRRALTE
jgi:hypothetical protein